MKLIGLYNEIKIINHDLIKVIQRDNILFLNKDNKPPINLNNVNYFTKYKKVATIEFVNVMNNGSPILNYDEDRKIFTSWLKRKGIKYNIIEKEYNNYRIPGVKTTRISIPLKYFLIAQ